MTDIYYAFCLVVHPSNRVMIIADGDADSGVDESTQAAEQAAETTESAKRPTTSRIPR